MQDIITQYPKNRTAPELYSNGWQLERVQALTGELKQLLGRDNSAFDDEIVHHQIDLLEYWMDCYRRNIITVGTFSGVSIALLNDLRARLKLAAEELQRLEDEGGNPATKEQAKKTDEVVKAVRRSEKLLSNIEELFNQ